MEILIGLFIIAIGAFCQSSCYVPINKIKDWSWESYWIVQGVFAWLILPFFGAMLAVPSGHSFFELFDGFGFNVAMSMLFGVLWGVGGLTFGLSMRYLGVALGQSIALGTCAGLGTIMGPVLLNIFFPELDALSSLTFSVILGVVVTLLGIAIIGVRAAQKSLLQAFLEPLDTLRKYEDEGKLFQRLALLEEEKTLPFGAVYDYFNLKNNIPVGEEYIADIEKYEAEVLAKRN